MPRTLNEGGWYTGLWVHEGLYYWLYGQALRLIGAGAAPIAVPTNPRAIFNGGAEVPLLLHATPLSPALARGVVAGRLANALLGLGTVVCVFLALTHATRRPSLAALGAGCLVLVPELGVRHAFISNDPLATFFASLSAMLALRWSPSSKTSSWTAGLIGAAAGCAVATKLTAGVIVLMMPLAFWMVRRGPHATVIRPVLARSVFAWMAGLIAFGTWPFIRNWIVFGDPLALALKHAIVAQLGSKAMFDLMDLRAYVEVVRLVFRSFWVTVGWAGFRPPVAWIWWLYGAWTLLCAAAFVLAVVAITRGPIFAAVRFRGARTDRLESDGTTRTMIAAVVVILNLLAFLLSVSRFPGYSARYLLPIVVPAVVVVAAGLRIAASALRLRIGEAPLAWVTWAGVVALALAWLVTLREVVLAYHFGWTS